MFFSSSIFSQILPEKQKTFVQSTTSSTKKSKPKPKSAVVKTKGNQTIILKIIPDADCKIYVDGELKGTANSGNMLRINLPKGDYIIKAVSTDNNIDRTEQQYNIDETGTEKILQIGLVSIINTRLRKENAAKGEKETAKKEALFIKKIIEEFESNMILVQGGSFNMGRNDGEYDQKPVHSVTLDNFYISKYEFTQANWRTLNGKDPSNFSGCDNCPVDQVSYNDAAAFCQKLSKMTGKLYRLPTEAEWEYAARGGSKGKGYKYSGDNNLDVVGWYITNSDSRTHSVGQKQPNELGLYDMTGNVWEWCSDWYNENYYVNSPNNNPSGPSSGAFRVVRGGSWADYSEFSHVTARPDFSPAVRNSAIGFRLVRSL